jgi:hypothetical protein
MDQYNKLRFNHQISAWWIPNMWPWDSLISLTFIVIDTKSKTEYLLYRFVVNTERTN